MRYLLRINKEVWKEFKGKKEGISMTMRINAWVNHFSLHGFERATFLLGIE